MNISNELINNCDTLMLFHKIATALNIDDMQKIFIDCLCNDNVALAEKCLQYIPKIDFEYVFDGVSGTPLIHASKYGKLKSVQFLLNAGADINYANSRDTTAIMYAFNKGHIQIVQYLYSKGASIYTNTFSISNHASQLNYHKYPQLIEYFDKKINKLNNRIVNQNKLHYIIGVYLNEIHSVCNKNDMQWCDDFYE